MFVSKGLLKMLRDLHLRRILSSLVDLRMSVCSRINLERCMQCAIRAVFQTTLGLLVAKKHSRGENGAYSISEAFCSKKERRTMWLLALFFYTGFWATPYISSLADKWGNPETVWNPFVSQNVKRNSISDSRRWHTRQIWYNQFVRRS